MSQCSAKSQYIKSFPKVLKTIKNGYDLRLPCYESLKLYLESAVCSTHPTVASIDLDAPKADSFLILQLKSGIKMFLRDAQFSSDVRRLGAATGNE
jgi:hypothetical protein